MIHLLAETQLPPDYNGLTILTVGTVIVLFLVAGGLLVGYQSARKGLAAEMRLQRIADDEAQKVEVQSPLVVQSHVQFVSKEEFDKEIKQAHGRMNRERDEARAAVEKLAARLDGEIEALTRQIDTYNTDANGRANAINERIDKLRTDVGEQGRGLSSAIAAMPGQLVQLIRNAQQI